MFKYKAGFIKTVLLLMPFFLIIYGCTGAGDTCGPANPDIYLPNNYNPREILVNISIQGNGPGFEVNDTDFIKSPDADCDTFNVEIKTTRPDSENYIDSPKAAHVPVTVDGKALDSVETGVWTGKFTWKPEDTVKIEFQFADSFVSYNYRLSNFPEIHFLKDTLIYQTIPGDSVNEVLVRDTLWTFWEGDKDPFSRYSFIICYEKDTIEDKTICEGIPGTYNDTGACIINYRINNQRKSFVLLTERNYNRGIYSRFMAGSQVEMIYREWTIFRLKELQ